MQSISFGADQLDAAPRIDLVLCFQQFFFYGIEVIVNGQENYREMPSHVTYVLSSVQRRMPLG